MWGSDALIQRDKITSRSGVSPQAGGRGGREGTREAWEVGAVTGRGLAGLGNGRRGRVTQWAGGMDAAGRTGLGGWISCRPHAAAQSWLAAKSGCKATGQWAPLTWGWALQGGGCVPWRQGCPLGQRWHVILFCRKEAFAPDRALASPGGFLAETSSPDTLYLWEKVGDPDDKTSQRTGSYQDSAVRKSFL